MDEQVYEIEAPTMSRAVETAIARADREGFYAVRQTAEIVRGDPRFDLVLLYRVTLLGDREGVWCPLRGLTVSETECVTGCAAPEQQVVCRMERLA